MLFDWNQGPLSEGLQCYRMRAFFEAHEHWEAVWLQLPKPEKTFLQALIQITVAFHHWQRGNPIGTRRLLERALHKLASFPKDFGGLDGAALCDGVAAWLLALDQGSPVVPPFPEIR